MDMPEFLMSLALGIALTLCLNTLISIPVAQIEKTHELCVDNGGVKEIDFSVIVENKAICNNGAMFYIRFNEGSK